MARARTRPRGFSLLELMIALIVSLLIVAGALALMISEQRSFQSTSRDRVLQEKARVALEAVAEPLRQAGFGVDPGLAFDLGPMTNVRMDRAPGNAIFATRSTATGLGAACAGLCRDSTAGPDEIVFYARDASFGPHPLTAGATAASTSLKMALLPGQTTVSLLRGQVLQLACYSGNMSWAYVTVSGPPVANGDGTVTVPIENDGTTVTTFPNQTGFLSDACFGSVATMLAGAVDGASLSSATEVFKVDRFHYYVASYDASGAQRPWGTPGSRPYLMLDQGLQGVDGKPIVGVISPDVEDLQLGFVFPSDPATPEVGETPGAALTNDASGIELSPASGCPAYSDPASSPTRADHHPGNIGAVRVGVVVRSEVPDPSLPDATIPASANRPALPGDAGYVRFQVETTIAVPNLSTQAPYFPAYGTVAAPGSRQFNVGGG